MKMQQSMDKLAIIANQKVKEGDYWKRQLAGKPVQTIFPCDYDQRTPDDPNRRENNETHSDTVKTDLQSQLSRQALELSGGNDYTLHVILVAGVAALLYKYTGHRDFVIGTPIYKQALEGEFINTLLPLRVRLDHGDSFKYLLVQVRQLVTEAVEHQSYPVEVLINRLREQEQNQNQKQEQFQGERAGLVDTAVLLRNIQEEAGIAAARPAVTFSFGRTGRDLDVEVHYRPRLYSQNGTRRILSHLEQLLTHLLKDVNAPLTRVEMVSAREKQQLLEVLNFTATGYPRDKNLAEFFRRQVGKNPEKVALEGPTLALTPSAASVSLTYRELHAKSLVLARVLQEKGGGPDTLVAIMVPPALEMVIGVLGILISGSAYLPIDAEYPADRVDYMLKDSSAKILVTAGTPDEEGKRVRRREGEKNVEILALPDFITSQPPNFPLLPSTGHRPPATSLAYVIYTSGTTGKPKGVIIDHGNVVRLLFNDAMPFDFTPQDVWTLFHSFCFDFSVWEMYGALLYGGRLAIIPRMVARDLRLYRELVAQKQVTVLNQTPSAFYSLMDLELKKPGKELRLRYVIFGGEALQPDRLKEWQARYPATTLVNMYGITETTVHVTYKGVSAVEIAAGVSNIGKPIPTLSAYVMDGDLQLLPPGVPGELCVGGAGVARGYLNRPGLTGQKFIPNPHRPGETLYRSGDLVCLLESGDLAYLGRIDHQVKIRGYRIELGEIETRLAAHEKIKEAVVIAADSEKDDKYLCAYLVAREAREEIPAADLREYLLRTLPGYMIPAYFVFLEHIPLTVNGKVNRKALPRPETQAGPRYIAPRDDVEAGLVKIWSEELGIEKEKIGIDANFFELGGHSLKATRIIARIHKDLGVNVPMVEMFAAPYIRTLAEGIKEMAAEKYRAVEVAEKKEYYALSSGQKRLFILQQMDEQGTAYNIPSFSQLTGDTREERLENAFKQLINRHESLRTSFQVVGETPVQVIHDEVEFAIEYVDATQAEVKVEAVMKEFTRPFGLAKAPLIRASLVKLREEKYVLAVEMHHIISDGVSEQILLQDFSALYSGRELARIRLQYKDYTQWQNHRQREEKLLEQKKYWINEFRGELPVLNLPVDYTRPAVQSYEGKTTMFTLDRERTAALKSLALETGTTLYMVLLSIYTLLLAKLAGQEDIVVGTPVAGRRHADLEKIIGMFINTLAMRSFPAKTKTFYRFLQEVKETALKAFENQDYQYEDLVEQVGVNRDVSRNPLFDTMFILQNMETRSLTIPGLSLSAYEYQNKTAKFDLTLTGMEIEDRLLFTFEYGTKLFAAAAIERFTGFFKRMTTEIPGKGKESLLIAEIDLIGVEEKRQILVDFNDTAVAYPLDETIHWLFAAQAQKTPDQIALVGPKLQSNGGSPGKVNPADLVYLSYRELRHRSVQGAYLFRQQGLRAGVLAAVMVERTVEMLIALLGILTAGAAYLPIDPDYPEERINYMLADSKATALVMAGVFAKKIERLNRREGAQHLELVFLDTLSSSSPGAPGLPGDFTAAAPVSPVNLAYVIYTSGSTGQPKGVMIEHKSVVNFIRGISARIPFLPGKTILAVTTLSFDIFVLETFLPLAAGLEILLASERQQLDPEALAELMVTHGVQMAQFTPSRLKMVLSHREDFEGLDYTTELLVGGEAFPLDLSQKVKGCFKGKIFNLYGPTETTVWSTSRDLTPLDGIDIGNPIANTQIYILDASLKIQPVGVVGDLYIGGAGVALGYLNKPELTFEKFNPDFSRNQAYPDKTRQTLLRGVQGGGILEKSPPGRRRQKIYQTGDLARWLPGGSIEFFGRRDHQVKIRGFRIELGEIENSLLKCREIEEAVVIDRQNREGQQYLCAYFVSPKKMGIADLKPILAGVLPDYMIPSYFIQVEKIPLMVSGKIDRKVLESYDLDMKIREEYAPPRNEIEQEIARMWREVLKLEKVGINENFFDLGGTSLDLIRLNLKFKEAFNEKDTAVQMFRYPTILSFAEYLSRKNEGTASDDIQRAIPVGAVKKSRQSQKNKRMRGGISHG